MADDHQTGGWPATPTPEERLIKAAGFPPDTAPDLFRKAINDKWAETLFLCRETALIKKVTRETGDASQVPAANDFTPEEVHELLIKARSGDRSIIIPSNDDLAVLALAEMFSGFREAVHTERAATYGVQIRRNLAKDIAALRDSLPKVRADLAYRVGRPVDPMERTGVSRTLNHGDYDNSIAKLDALDAAIREVCDIDFLFGPALVQFDHWHIFAEPLGYAFATTVTRTGENRPPLRNAMYRFVHAAIPLLTGEEPSLAAIRSHLARHRSANYRKYSSLSDLYP